MPSKESTAHCAHIAENWSKQAMKATPSPESKLVLHRRHAVCGRKNGMSKKNSGPTAVAITHHELFRLVVCDNPCRFLLHHSHFHNVWVVVVEP